MSVDIAKLKAEFPGLTKANDPAKLIDFLHDWIQGREPSANALQELKEAMVGHFKAQLAQCNREELDTLVADMMAVEMMKMIGSEVAKKHGLTWGFAA